jgi:hypothetical protein
VDELCFLPPPSIHPSIHPSSSLTERLKSHPSSIPTSSQRLFPVGQIHPLHSILQAYYNPLQAYYNPRSTTFITPNHSNINSYQCGSYSFTIVVKLVQRHTFHISWHHFDKMPLPILIFMILVYFGISIYHNFLNW